MEPRQDIAILDLLRLREEEFVRIWSCEEEIRHLLGLSAYPFPPPPDLPSRHRIRRKPSAEAAKGEPGAAPPELRPLRPPQENAYHVVYQRDGLEEDSFLTDPAVIATLMTLNAPNFALLSVETVQFRSPESWKVVETLWNAAP
jgi:hypothetical protein